MQFTKEEQGEIIIQYTPLIIASIKRHCNYMHHFEDLLAEGKMEILRALKAYDPTRGARLPHHLKVYLRTYFLNRRKSLKRRECQPLHEEAMGGYDPYENLETKRYVEELLNSLPQDQSLILRRYYLEEKRVSDIAEELDIPKRRVYHLKEKALSFLRRQELAKREEHLRREKEREPTHATVSDKP